MRRLLSGILMASIIVVLPALGNPSVFGASHLWIVMVIAILASVLQPDYHPVGIVFSSGDRGTGAQIIWSVSLVQLLAVLEATYLRFPQSMVWDAAADLALIGCLTGLSLRTWAVVTLGKLFTMHISISENHQVVCHGPYELVRHPSYLGGLILSLSAVILLHAWYAALLAIVILPLAFLRRIHFEEKRLLSALGEDYESYRMRTKQKLIPCVF
jgi:protein-S-isoprenylcysteine O-methyltransferase Ste14